MRKKSFFEEVESVLKKDKRFVSEKGELLRNAVIEAAQKMDADLLKALHANTTTRKRFFTDVDGIAVFDKQQFEWVVSNRAFLPDSYTRFRNKIGLAVGDDMIASSPNVELVFPYKDCVLEGGQTKEDQKRDEIFYNTTLAPDEVDRLLAPKVLTNAVRYDAKGKKAAVTFNIEEDNLVIKGNNLLALYSLLPKFERSIKCIYIDPPYYFSVKKEEDTFEYNSNFKLSSWLAFMKDRLEVARKLLRKDGAIFVQISDDGVAELHCLLKGIFGPENFVNKITVRTKSPSGFASVNPGVFETAEYILCFAKDKRKWTFNPQFVKSDYDPNYKWFVKNKNASVDKWQIVDVESEVANRKGFRTKAEAVKAIGRQAFNDSVADFALINADSVFRQTVIGTNAGREVIALKEKSLADRKKIFTLVRDGHYQVYVLNGEEMAFYSKKVRMIDGCATPCIQLTNIWNDTPYEGISKEGGVKLKGGKKPEKLIRRIIEMSSNPGDIVLDFHLGSGTTCAVAHKIGRRYIGVEQLQGQVDKLLVRLPSVISGEQSGISKAVGWKGGESFVYCELAKSNQKFVERIEAAKKDSELEKIWVEILETGFISCKIDPAKFSMKDEDFKVLSLKDKKRILMDLLDMNQLYVNYCDIDDKTFKVSAADKAFTKSFYGDK